MEKEMNGFASEAEKDWKAFWKDYRAIGWCLAVVVFLVYGLRLMHDNIFLDSEIMMLRPEEMEQQWLSNGRFGLVFTRRLFGMGRMIPYLEAALMMAAMWVAGILLSFCAYEWCGKNRRYGRFLYLFPVMFLVCPVFAEHYLFLLQAFEVALGMVLCIVAAGCVGRLVYEDESIWWLVPGLVCMVWAFGSYQVMMAFYICLVLCSFLLSYMNGKSERAFQYGCKHVLVFLGGAVLYALVSAVCKRVSGIDTDYVSGQFRWGVDDWRNCLAGIWAGVVPVLKGQNVFFGKFYFPVMCLFGVQALIYGWRKKQGGVNYCWFVLGLVLMILSPFFLMLVSGGVMPLRTQLVYPVTSAFFLAHLTVCPEESERKGWTRAAVTVMTVVCGLQAMKSGQSAVQLFQTSWEAYRNDVLTSNRIYEDVCDVVEGDIRDYKVIFVGGRDAGLAGPMMRGELLGLSLYEAEAHTAVGVTGRVISLFQILGLETGGIESGFDEYYARAKEAVAAAPVWPETGSIVIVDDVAAVKLSE